MTEHTDIIERLRDRCDRKFINALCEDAAAEIERLLAEIERLRTQNDMIFTDAAALTQAVDALAMASREQRVKVERLEAALQPFALNVKAVSLRDALGHISREDLLRARAALDPQP